MSGLQKRFDLVTIQICEKSNLPLTENFKKMRELYKKRYYELSEEERNKLIAEWDSVGL